MHGKKRPLVGGWRVYQRQSGGDRQTSEEASAGVRVRVHESLNPWDGRGGAGGRGVLEAGLPSDYIRGGRKEEESGMTLECLA